MNFNEYQHLSAFTALYPPEMVVVYPALGLAGEAGEVCNKVKKIVRDDGGQITNGRALQIIDECGGVLWYSAALLRDLESAITNGVAVLPKYLPPIYHSAITMANKACIAASIAERSLTQEVDWGEFGNALVDALKYLNCVLYHVGSNLELAMERNLAKLTDRQARGTLKGDGDNR